MKALYVTDRRSAGDSRFKKTLSALSDAPGLLVQLREKETADRECLGWAALARAALGGGVPLFVNRRFDIALAAGADGVHLPAAGLPVPRVRAATPRGFRIGVSTHSPEEAAARIEEGADLILIGPIFDTPSKRAFGPPLGLRTLRELPEKSAHSTEVFAIGGVSEENVEELAPYADRIAGIAAVRLFQDAADPRAVLDRIVGR